MIKSFRNTVNVPFLHYVFLTSLLLAMLTYFSLLLIRTYSLIASSFFMVTYIILFFYLKRFKNDTLLPSDFQRGKKYSALRKAVQATGLILLSIVFILVSDSNLRQFSYSYHFNQTLYIFDEGETYTRIISCNKTIDKVEVCFGETMYLGEKVYVVNRLYPTKETVTHLVDKETSQVLVEFLYDGKSTASRVKNNMLVESWTVR